MGGVWASPLWIMELSSSHIILSYCHLLLLGQSGTWVSEWGHHLGSIVMLSVALSVLFKDVNIICLPQIFTLFSSLSLSS